MSRSKFFDKIRVSTIERQVEDCYNEGISFYLKETNGDPIKFTYPYACDGIIETKTQEGKLLKLLMEYLEKIDESKRYLYKSNNIIIYGGDHEIDRMFERKFE